MSYIFEHYLTRGKFSDDLLHHYDNYLDFCILNEWLVFSNDSSSSRKKVISMLCLDDILDKSVDLDKFINLNSDCLYFDFPISNSNRLHSKGIYSDGFNSQLLVVSSTADKVKSLNDKIKNIESEINRISNPFYYK